MSEKLFFVACYVEHSETSLFRHFPNRCGYLSDFRIFFKTIARTDNRLRVEIRGFCYFHPIYFYLSHCSNRYYNG